MLVLQIYKGFAEGDAVAVNEHGVAVAGGLALGKGCWTARSARCTWGSGNEAVDGLLARGGEDEAKRELRALLRRRGNAEQAR